MITVSPFINLLFWLMYLPCSLGIFLIVKSQQKITVKNFALIILLGCIALGGCCGLVMTSPM